jgi:hypothetical protein
MSQLSAPGSPEYRPDFMATLGLAPPYAVEDVKAAYREKAKLAHPDRGGSVEAFHEVQEAFERAQQYLEFRSDRRAWIASHMERYVEVERAIDRLRRLGAQVTTRAPEWLAQSFGDFAQLTESAYQFRAPGAANGDALIAALVAEHKSLRELREIEMPGANVSDGAVLSLGVFSMVAHLDLSDTPITRRSLALADQLEALESFHVTGTKIGWWQRRRLAARLRRRAAE